jgi:hypothetical protein
VTATPLARSWRGLVGVLGAQAAALSANRLWSRMSRPSAGRARTGRDSPPRRGFVELNQNPE